MAEYIDRTLLELDTEWSDYYDEFMSYSQSQIQGMPAADVVKREEYIELLKENERLRGDLEFKSEALNSIGQIHKEYVSKIDKAIEEICKINPVNEDGWKTCDDLKFEVLEILKRNMED